MSNTHTVPDVVAINGRKLKATVNKNLVVLNVIYTITIVVFVYLVISTALPLSLMCVSVLLLGGIKYLLDKLFIRTCFIDGAMDALIERTQ